MDIHPATTSSMEARNLLASPQSLDSNQPTTSSSSPLESSNPHATPLITDSSHLPASHSFLTPSNYNVTPLYENFSNAHATPSFLDSSNPHSTPPCLDFSNPPSTPRNVESSTTPSYLDSSNPPYIDSSNTPSTPLSLDSRSPPATPPCHSLQGKKNSLYNHCWQKRGCETQVKIARIMKF